MDFVLTSFKIMKTLCTQLCFLPLLEKLMTWPNLLCRSSCVVLSAVWHCMSQDKMSNYATVRIWVRMHFKKIALVYLSQPLNMLCSYQIIVLCWGFQQHCFSAIRYGTANQDFALTSEAKPLISDLGECCHSIKADSMTSDHKLGGVSQRWGEKSH